MAVSVFIKSLRQESVILSRLAGPTPAARLSSYVIFHNCPFAKPVSLPGNGRLVSTKTEYERRRFFIRGLVPWFPVFYSGIFRVPGPSSVFFNSSDRARHSKNYSE